MLGRRFLIHTKKGIYGYKTLLCSSSLSLGGSTISIESSKKITSLTIHNLQVEFAKLRNVELDKTVILNIIKLAK